MSRGRVATGLAVACAGTAIWVDAVAAPLATLLEAIPYALIVLAVIGGLQALHPPVALVGPGVLLLAGAGWLAVRHGLIGMEDVVPAGAAALVVGGWVVALAGGRSRRRRGHGSVHRIRTAFLSRTFPHADDANAEAPAKLAVTAVLGGSVTVDLRRNIFPRGVTAMEIDVTSLGGSVEILLPPTWIIGPGRIVERGVTLTGSMGWTDPVLSVDDLPEENVRPRRVVLNIVALRGRVAVPERSRQEEGSPRAG